MTGAMFKTVLGGLGIPPSWFAAHLGVTMRTVVRWFDVDAVPQRVADAVAELEKTASDEMAGIAARAKKRNGVLLLGTYRIDDEYGHPVMPATWHRMLTFRVLEQLRGEDKNVSVEYVG